jgi:anti-anti-sigma regulatory factor
MLKIAVNHEDARVPVTVMSLEGELDAATYLEVLDTARQLVADGSAHVLLDLESLSYMGSSGLFVIHSVAMLLQGLDPPSPEDGWGAIHQTDRDESAAAERLKLLGAQPQVDRVLERSGLKRYFECYSDRSEAIGSF